ncbi:LbetaH domain-containing protein [Granulibacter bethesdensis]|uniref:hypothetical protein n=1 Tax=Granulibacter bethesdensis TaxID=364410 RepID=UPI0003F1DA4B|nr:hypothetical protein [Granulibacter bethesdensis]AHJ69066.1 Acetyltransferase [Granulibacter bethesdensis]
MMRSLALFGAGSALAVDVEESCRRNGINLRVLVRNTEHTAHPDVEAPSITLEEITDDLIGTEWLIPLFTPANRKKAWQHATSLGLNSFASLLDASSVYPSRLSVEEGVYVNSGCTIGACSRLGRFSLINRGCSVGHHLSLGAFSSIGPGAVLAGEVTVEEEVMIGAGAIILPTVRIGARARIGAGAVVRKDVPPGALVAAPDARVLLRTRGG